MLTNRKTVDSIVITTPRTSRQAINLDDREQNMKRGEDYPGTNGRYVGTAKNETVWVAYPNDDFAKMCEDFDRLQGFRDIKADTLEALKRIAYGANASDMSELLNRLVSDLSSSLVSITVAKPAPAGVIPEYNPKTDGPYSAWLAANNID